MKTILTAVAVGALTGAVLAHGPTARRPASPAPTDGLGADADNDARRAAAERLLIASRFRERQAVVLPEGLKAAQADLTAECVDRAATGRSLADCRATASPTGAGAARLGARRSDMLDEIMVASQTAYARRFTAGEMDEITRFFRTPVGRKYGDLYPQLIAEVGTRRAAIIRHYMIAADRGGPR